MLYKIYTWPVAFISNESEKVHFNPLDCCLRYDCHIWMNQKMVPMRFKILEQQNDLTNKVFAERSYSVAASMIVDECTYAAGLIPLLLNGLGVVTVMTGVLTFYVLAREIELELLFTNVYWKSYRIAVWVITVLTYGIGLAMVAILEVGELKYWSWDDQWEMNLYKHYSFFQMPYHV